MIHLYHGSTVNIEQIDLRKSRPNKDFGRGFYLSADREQAWRMGEFKALTEGGTPVMNEYVLTRPFCLPMNCEFSLLQSTPASGLNLSFSTEIIKRMSRRIPTTLYMVR